MKSMNKRSMMSWVLGLSACALMQSAVAIAGGPGAAAMGTANTTSMTMSAQPSTSNYALLTSYQFHMPAPIGPTNCKPGYVYRVTPNSLHQRSVASSGTCVAAGCNTIVNATTGKAECKVNSMFDNMNPLGNNPVNSPN